MSSRPSAARVPTRSAVRRCAAAGVLAVLATTACGAPTTPSGALAAPASRPSVSSVSHAPAVELAARRVPRASRSRTRTALPAPRHLVLRTVAVGPSFSGRASWYGGSFQGRRTASGERFNSADLTAASKTLPFGTRLRVCRLSRCVIVRINDRGPFVRGRILDLSQAADRALGSGGVSYVTATPVRTALVDVRPGRHDPPRVHLAALVRPLPVAQSAVPLAHPSPQPQPEAPASAVLVGLVGLGALGAARLRRDRNS